MKQTKKIKRNKYHRKKFNKSFIQIGGIENNDRCIFINLLPGQGLGNQLYIFAAGLVVKNRTGLPICAIPSTGNPHSTKDYTTGNCQS